jgi:hypothetical protein
MLSVNMPHHIIDLVSTCSVSVNMPHHVMDPVSICYLSTCHGSGKYPVYALCQEASPCYGSVSVADPDPGSGAFLTPASGLRDPGWVKNQDPDSG